MLRCFSILLLVAALGCRAEVSQPTTAAPAPAPQPPAEKEPEYKAMDFGELKLPTCTVFAVHVKPGSDIWKQYVPKEHAGKKDVFVQGFTIKNTSSDLIFDPRPYCTMTDPAGNNLTIIAMDVMTDAGPLDPGEEATYYFVGRLSPGKEGTDVRLRLDTSPTGDREYLETGIPPAPATEP